MSLCENVLYTKAMAGRLCKASWGLPKKKRMGDEKTRT